MKSSVVAALGAAVMATLGASSAARASIINFEVVISGGSVTYTGTSLDVSTALDLDSATLLVKEVGAGDESGLAPFDAISLSAATSPPSSQIEYGSTPGPLGADVTLSWPMGAGPGADAFTETLTTVTSINQTTANAITVIMSGTVSDTGGKFTDAPVSLTLHAVQDAAQTAPPIVSFSNTTTVSSVPEASTWTMVALGFGALGYAASRRRRANISRLSA